MKSKKLTTEQKNNIPILRKTHSATEVAEMYRCAVCTISKYDPTRRKQKDKFNVVSSVETETERKTIDRNRLSIKRMQIIQPGQSITLVRQTEKKKKVISGVVIAKGINSLTVRNRKGRNEGVTLADMITMKVAIR